MPVLLVEDEPTIAITLSDDLRDAGYDVTHVADGAQALALLQEHAFAAVVTDLRLPGADGLQIAAAALARMPHAAVLVVTAWAAVVQAAAPHVPVLAKPFANGTVLAWLRERVAS